MWDLNGFDSPLFWHNACVPDGLNANDYLQMVPATVGLGL